MIEKNIRNSELENHHCLQINRLPARSILIPAKTAGVYYKNKEKSALLQSLNGDWHFKYEKSDCIDNFYKNDYDASAWDAIDVPSMWQYRGYGNPEYPNVRYPIPFNPPFVCCENPVGYYRRKFIIEEKTGRTILHFGGVDNAFYVYINGTFVGFSKGSRIPAEFDVSALVKKGENEIAVKVFTYSDATYLENQDMLLASGIFRDVYLLHVADVNLWDYRVTTTMDSFTVNAKLDFHGEDGWKVVMELDGQRFEADATEEISNTFCLDNPRLWNAEEPNLYDLTITLTHNGEATEIHSKKVGIMHTWRDGIQFIVNGNPVFIKGVNRHEHDWENGRAISVELIEKELRMIKDNNLNAIRCSHYTNHPAFYEIASEIGLYVMDEADLETHGCGETLDQGHLSKNPDWLDAYLDRVSRMLSINKNEPCIFIWSMGNECGTGENLDKCLEYTREFDPTRAMLYSQEEPENKVDPSLSDFIRDGYMSVEQLNNFSEAQKPVMLIEYAHAMGNSPGFLQGYQDYIYANPHFCGGFVWEFKNHGFKAYDEDGKETVLYGGDFNDNTKHHWYNFCLDGFLTADGTPKPTWYELGEVYAPICAKLEGGKVKLTNTNDFRSSEYLTLKWEIACDFNRVRKGEMTLPAIMPHKSGCIDIDMDIENPESGAKYFLNLSFFDGEREISKKQLELPVFAKKKTVEEGLVSGEIEQSGNMLVVNGDKFKVSFDGGLLSYYEVDGELLINAPMKLNFYRATIDNDGIMCREKWFSPWFFRSAGEWSGFYIDRMNFHCENYKYEKLESHILVIAEGNTVADFAYVGFKTVITYKIFADGKVLVDLKCEPYGNTPKTYPRMGVCFEVKKKFGEATWYGRGPLQNYADAKAGATVGLYSENVAGMNFEFDMPQETGNREDTEFVRVHDGNTGLGVIGCDSFSFSYHDFALKALDDAKHRNELKKADKNYLYIDYKTRGLGSHSCGPDPEPEFELRPHTFEFAFLLTASKDNDSALSLARTDFGVHSQALSDTYVFDPGEVQKQIADCKAEEN